MSNETDKQTEAKAQAEEAAFVKEAKRLSKETGHNGHRLLAHELEGIRKALNALSKNVGKGQYIQTYVLRYGLAAIALAASTPTDNSEEVKVLTARFRTQREALEAAKDAANPPLE